MVRVSRDASWTRSRRSTAVSADRKKACDRHSCDPTSKLPHPPRRPLRCNCPLADRCGPCREEAPALQEVYDIARASGVTVLGVAVRDDQQAAAGFMRDRNLSYPSLFDQPGRTLQAFRGFPRNTIPSTLVLDRSHRVAAVFLTTVRASELLSVVQRVASEPG